MIVEWIKLKTYLEWFNNTLLNIHSMMISTLINSNVSVWKQ